MEHLNKAPTKNVTHRQARDSTQNRAARFVRKTVKIKLATKKKARIASGQAISESEIEMLRET